MLFNSLDFLVFFPLVTVIYFLLPHRVRWLHLLAASCIFYMFFIPAYILILLFTITIDYIAGITIEKTSGRSRKLLLYMSLVCNLGVLAGFKYAVFFISQLNSLFHVFHSSSSLPAWNIILPIGLSFHTFQAMSYTTEVYRGNHPAERHFGLFALYVLFYPQLVAGPIERPSGLLDQLRERHTFNWGDAGAGLRLMLWGFFKKLVIADRIAGYVNYVYGNADQLSSGYILIAVVLFSFQIYCDFSGYSDIAMGAARVMGFRLRTNFNRPYFASNIREFWARWHISLSTWFRDYVYIPLGGNRSGRGRRYVNIIIVFLLSGIWHGAGWNFIIWGAFHALIMMSWMYWSDRGSKEGQVGDERRLMGDERRQMGGERRPIGRPVRVMGGLGTFVLVTIGWVFFRIPEPGQVLHILSRLAGCRGNVHFEANITRTSIGLSVAFVIILLVLEKYMTPRMEELRGRFWPDVAFCGFVLGSILLFGVFGSQPFIYFQF